VPNIDSNNSGSLKSPLNLHDELFDFLSSAVIWMKAKLVLIDSGRHQELTFESSNYLSLFQSVFWDISFYPVVTMKKCFLVTYLCLVHKTDRIRSMHIFEAYSSSPNKQTYKIRSSKKKDE